MKKPAERAAACTQVTQAELDALLALAKTTFPAQQYQLLEEVLGTFVYVMQAFRTPRPRSNAFARCCSARAPRAKTRCSRTTARAPPLTRRRGLARLRSRPRQTTTQATLAGIRPRHGRGTGATARRPIATPPSSKSPWTRRQRAPTARNAPPARSIDPQLRAARILQLDRALAPARRDRRRRGYQFHEPGVDLAAPRRASSALQALLQAVMVDPQFERDPVQAMLLGQTHRSRPQRYRYALASLAAFTPAPKAPLDLLQLLATPFRLLDLRNLVHQLFSSSG